ncbi:MAG: hypothetical protein JF595_06640 [Sphingomonadales bacterium]|nr:hypothetical protein [Sphingomonadales bacterium]
MLSPVGRRVCGSQGGASIVASSTGFLSYLDPFLAFLIAAPLPRIARFGGIIRPLTAFHPIQIFACAVIAQRYRSTCGAEMRPAGSSAS